MCPFGPPWRAYSPKPPPPRGHVWLSDDSARTMKTDASPADWTTCTGEHSRSKATGPSRSATNATVDMTVLDHHVWDRAHYGPDGGGRRHTSRSRGALERS